MPDPQLALDFNLVTPRPRADERSLPSATPTTSPAQDSARHPATNGILDTTNPSYDQNNRVAYAASLSSDIVFRRPLYSNVSLATTHEEPDTGIGQFLPERPANAQQTSNLRLAQFDQQPWTQASAPYLGLAPQPAYNPAGELLPQNVHHFDQFDDPSSFGQPTWQSQAEPTVILTTSKTTVLDEPGVSPSASQIAQQTPKSALKRIRDADAVPASDRDRQKRQKSSEPEPRRDRKVSFEHMSGADPGTLDADSSSSDAANVPRSVAQARAAAASQRRGRTLPSGRGPGQRAPAPAAIGTSGTQQASRGSKDVTGHPPPILPPEKVFPIQIGSELFRLSGASISSDAPSYFTQFFEEQIKQNEESVGVRTLYIDRDPETFRDVARHLQGYYIKPRDGSHFVKLFADAQFYSLPRLIDQLFESEIFIQIGEKHFQIPKDIFSDPGNSPNFFSLGFAVFFSTPGEVFPGLDRRGLLRPPSITPPYVPGRSAKIFAQLLHLLRGYPLHIENEDHRAELLRDCRYFHLRGLEQKLIAHHISYNLERQKHEICVQIEDIKPSGITYRSDEQDTGEASPGGWVRYARPFVDDNPFELIVEIGSECTILSLDDMRADFHGLAKARVSSLFQVVANKMNLPTNAPLGLMVLSGGGSASRSASPGHTPLSEDRVKVRFEPASDITLDGTRYEVDWDSQLGRNFSQGPMSHSASGEQAETESDPMSEDETTPSQQATASSASASTPTSRGQQSSIRGRKTTSIPPAGSGRAQSLATPTTHQPSSRKRRRPTISATSASDNQREWVIRSGQWRLRVQPSPQDAIRGGYEIVFLAVKLDAFSHEKARNARRNFLGR